MTDSLTQRKILIAGAGRVGSLLACLLAESGAYQVILADADAAQLRVTRAHILPIQVDITVSAELTALIKNYSITALVSCLPYYYNVALAQIAAQFNIAYFDTTEDVSVASAVEKLAHQSTSVFVPGCGLAPGFINLAAHALMQTFDQLDTVKLRVGCLPLVSDHPLQYALTWSTDGLINEYGNACFVIAQQQTLQVAPLENVETIELDGVIYEAFNTSGGVGSLLNTYAGKVKNLNYKTIRYPGHAEKMRFLMNDLKLNEDRPTLKRVLENALPRIHQDVALIYISVNGTRNNAYTEENFIKKYYARELFEKKWTALQITTAASTAAVIDLVLAAPKKFSGFIKQEQINMTDFLANQFGRYLQ